MTKTIMHWRAARSGASITIKGQDSRTGENVKISGVKLIQVASDGRLTATTDRETFYLDAPHAAAA